MHLASLCLLNMTRKKLHMFHRIFHPPSQNLDCCSLPKPLKYFYVVMKLSMRHRYMCAWVGLIWKIEYICTRGWRVMLQQLEQSLLQNQKHCCSPAIAACLHSCTYTLQTQLVSLHGAKRHCVVARVGAALHNSADMQPLYGCKHVPRQLQYGDLGPQQCAIVLTSPNNKNNNNF